MVETKNLQQAIFEKCHKALLNTVPAASLLTADSLRLSPTVAMFLLAVDGMTGSPMSGLTEESLTANFAGRLAAQFAWAVECIGNEGGKAAMWGEYSKNGQGEQSESKRGADFALVVPVSDHKVKVAIFQAKKVLNESANISQAGSKHAPDPQKDKLYDTAQVIAAAAHVPDDESLTWVHYVFWREMNKFPKSISLAQLKPILIDTEIVNLSKIDTSKGIFGSFAELLVAATSKEDASDEKQFVVAGWLHLDLEAAKVFLPELCALTDVVFADEEGQGGDFANLLAAASDNCLDVKIEPVNQQSIVAQEVVTRTTKRSRKNSI
ncbi:hypothetical protein V3C40_27720 [Janthinobacterium sp. LS2A]|uniref:hypothetical protein n=1 Tax=Janthinobacterium sp. LS2A TaxID=3118590 RepID=UPI002F950D58